MAEEIKDYEVVNETQEVGFELSVKTLPEIIDNRKKFFGYLDVTLEQFKDITLTEDTVKNGKDTVAKLRKAKELIDTKRKDVKKEILKPYEDVESFCKEANRRIDAVITPITDQLDAFETKRIETKRGEIGDAWNDELMELNDPKLAKFIKNCTFTDNPQWLNATFTMSKVKKEIKAIIEKVRNDISVLAQTLVDESFKAVALTKYRETGDVSKTIQEYNWLLEQRKAQETVAKAQPKAEEEAEPETPRQIAMPSEVARFRYHLEVDMNESEFGCLIQYFKANNIHGLVKKKEEINAES